MMEPHASIAAWDGDKLTLWTSNQMIDWGARRPREDARHPEGERPPHLALSSAAASAAKLFVRADALLAALGARAAGRPGESGAASER